MVEISCGRDHATGRGAMYQRRRARCSGAETERARVAAGSSYLYILTGLPVCMRTLQYVPPCPTMSHHVPPTVSMEHAETCSGSHAALAMPKPIKRNAGKLSDMTVPEKAGSRMVSMLQRRARPRHFMVTARL